MYGIQQMNNSRCVYRMVPRMIAPVAAVLLAGGLQADTYTWSTNTTGAAQDGSGVWNTEAANWVDAGGVHTTWDNTGGDTAAFGVGGTAGTVTVDADGVTIGGLLFNADVTGAYTLSGGPLTLSGTPVFTVNTNATIAAPLAGTVDFSKTGTGTLTLSSLNSSFDGDITIAQGTLAAKAGQSSRAPTNSALGHLLVPRTITVEDGAALSFLSHDVFGIAGVKPPVTINVKSGGAIRNNGTFNVLGPVNLEGGALTTTGGAYDGYQAFQFTDTVTAGGSATINTMGGTYNGVHVDNNLFDVTGGTLTVSAPLINRYNNGSAGFVKAGVGTMVLAADNRFNGAVTVSNGLLQVGDGGAAGTLGTGVSAVNLVNDDVTLLVNRSGFLGHSGAISGDGSLVKDGESVLTLSGANSYTGNTVISNGVLAVTIEDALPGYAAAGRVLLEPGAALSVGVGSWTTDAINTLLATGIYGPETGFGFDTTAGNYTYNGQFTLPTVARLVKTGPNALTITGGNTCPGSVLALGGILQGDFGAGLPAATNVTLGNATLSSVSGVLTPSLGEGAGQVTIMAGFPAGFSAVDVPLTVNVGGAGETLSWGTTEFNPSALVLNGLGANTNLTLVNGINLNGATRVVNVDASGAGAEAEITGVIANGSGVAGLVKGGAGTLRLTVPSTYTGGTTVDAGTLELIGGNNHLDTGADITVNAATLDLGGNTQALTAGTFTLGDGAVLRNGTFNYRDTSWSPKFGASVSFGTGGSFTTPHRLLLKDAQALTLTADAGTSVFGGDGANSCNFVGVDDARSNTVTVAGGSLNFTNMASGAGFMRLGANGTATTKPIGVLNVSGGEVNVGHAMGLGTRHDNRLAAAYGEGVLNLSGGSVNVGTGSSTATGNGRLGWLYLGNGHGSTASKSTLNLNGGTLSVVQIEAGASGVNTLHLNGGTLRARADNATFLNGANLMAHVYERGLTLDTADYDVGVGVNLSGAGTLTKTGAGTLMLSGGNTYSGVTTVEEGTLKLSPLGGANLVLHLDASDVSTLFQNADGSDAVTTSGQPVGYWGDLSDSGKPATQAITVRRPIYVTDVAEFNNKAVIEFDGTDDSLTSLLNINPDSLPNMTIVIVYKQLPENGNGGLWGHDNGYWDRLQLFYNVGTYYQVATSNAAVSVKGMETNVVTVYSAVLRNDVPGGSYVYINGISDATTGLPAFTSVDSGGTPDLTLGSIGAGNTGYAGRCQIAEVLVFDTALSDTARRNVEVRLRNKWLGASDPVTPVLQSGTSVQLMAETQPNLKLHLDASVRSSLFTDAAGVGAVTESGHPVGYWSDLSGNAKPATQATLSRRPTYVTAARGFCGLPAVEFDGADDSLTSLLNINADEMPNMTIVIAYKQLPESGNGGLWGHDNGGWDRLQLFRNGNIYYQIATANAAESVKGMKVDVVTVYSAVLRNGVPGGSYVYINGVSDATTGLPAFTSVDSGGSADLTLGSIGTGNVNYAGRCQIGEVLVFDTALDNMARQNVEAYLRDKWQNGIPGRIELAAGAVLDLDGAVQEVTAISGGGTVSNGTLSVTELLSPAGTAVGTLGVADVTLSGVLRVNVTPAGTCDRLVGSGDLSLTGLTLQIAKLELLNPEMTYTVATCTGTLTGPFAETNLPANWRVRYDVGAGTAVFYYAEPGTLFQMK